MTEWHDIESAPTDGRTIWVKRIHKGTVITEGWAVWGINSDDAPMRQWASGGLYAPIAPDNAYADTARWLTEDRRFSFPTPTHWLPELTAQGTSGSAEDAKRLSPEGAGPVTEGHAPNS